MYQLINKFIESAKEIEGEVFPFLANKKSFNPETDSVAKLFTKAIEGPKEEDRIQ